jgi:MFS family permease
MDWPVQPRTEAEIRAERDRNYRWNFAVNMGDVASFWIGLSFISAVTIVPLYISKLTDSTLAIGLAAVIAQGSWYLPQLFTANFVERLPRKKPMVVNLGFFLERLPMWAIVLSPLIAAWNPTLALVTFFLAYAWHGFGAGLVATSWQELIARCFPAERRGQFMGISLFIGTLVGAIAAGFSARLLANYPFPLNFVYIFTIAAAAITVSWLFVSLTREPVERIKSSPQSTRQYWTELPRILRRDTNFRHFLISRLLFAFAGMGMGFVTVAAIQRWGISDSIVAGYTVAFLMGQTAGNLILGVLADKRGHMISLEIGAFITFLAFTIAWLAPTEQWFYLVFFLLGINTAATLVSGIMVVFEFSPPEKRPTYTGLTNTSVGVASMLGPLLGAALALLGYSWLFMASAILSLLALLGFHWWVREPRFAHVAPVETKSTPDKRMRL